jgi:hypothetical protein
MLVNRSLFAVHLAVSLTQGGDAYSLVNACLRGLKIEAVQLTGMRTKQ